MTSFRDGFSGTCVGSNGYRVREALVQHPNELLIRFWEFRSGGDDLNAGPKLLEKVRIQPPE